MKEYMKREGLNQSSLVEITGCSGGTVSKWLSGKQEMKSGSIEAIAEKMPELVCYALNLDCKKNKEDISIEDAEKLAIEILEKNIDKDGLGLFEKELVNKILFKFIIKNNADIKDLLFIYHLGKDAGHKSSQKVE